MGRLFLVELEGRSYRCRYCHTPLALADDVLSQAFNSSRGRAYLFNKAQLTEYVPHVKLVVVEGKCEFLLRNSVNISVGNMEERMMTSGMHTVSDIFCCCCGQILGWKYVSAHDKSQKYKEGKFVLERWRISEDIADEVNGDARLSLSDAETA